MPNVNELKRLIESLSQTERYQLQAMLASSGEKQESVKSLEDRRFSNGIFYRSVAALRTLWNLENIRICRDTSAKTAVPLLPPKTVQYFTNPQKKP